MTRRARGRKKREAFNAHPKPASKRSSLASARRLLDTSLSLSLSLAGDGFDTRLTLGHPVTRERERERERERASLNGSETRERERHRRRLPLSSPWHRPPPHPLFLSLPPSPPKRQNSTAPPPTTTRRTGRPTPERPCGTTTTRRRSACEVRVFLSPSLAGRRQRSDWSSFFSLVCSLLVSKRPRSGAKSARGRRQAHPLWREESAANSCEREGERGKTKHSKQRGGGGRRAIKKGS